MFAVLKRKNPEHEAVRRVYSVLLKQVRKPWFYEQAGVPDSFDGRYDLLLLHVFLVVNRLVEEGPAAREFNQALFDITFADADQTLREMGIGDMGVPKHMRRMMKAFNGRMHAYAQALEDDALEEALRRNLYGTLEKLDRRHIDSIKAYCLRHIDALQAQPAADIMRGVVSLEDPSDRS